MVKFLALSASFCGLVDGSWKGFCEDSPNICGDYCTKNPSVCDEICEQVPTINGCAPGENCNCDSADAECLACKAGEDVPTYCAKNRDTKGCDEVCCEQGCSEECKEQLAVTLRAERTCKWFVPNQLHTIFRPTIYEANVEKDCPFEENLEMHLELCQKCSKLHEPCNDQHVACGGCCGTPYHSLLNFSVNTHHTCPQMKDYFKNRRGSTVTLECEEPPASDIPLGEVVVEMEVPENAFDWGILSTSCETNVTSVECNKVPLKFEFVCTDCGNKGTQTLLTQCCDKCREWAENVKDHVKLPEGVEPFVFCTGCDATHIEMTSAILPPFPWENAGKYDDLSEAEADRRVDAYLEKEVCSLLGEECPSDDGSRRLRGDARLLTEGDEQESNSDCLQSGGHCVDTSRIGRRLADCSVEEMRERLQNRSVRQSRRLAGDEHDLNSRVGSTEEWETEVLEPEVMCAGFNPELQSKGIYRKTVKDEVEAPTNEATPSNDDDKDPLDGKDTKGDDTETANGETANGACSVAISTGLAALVLAVQ